MIERQKFRITPTQPHQHEQKKNSKRCILMYTVKIENKRNDKDVDENNANDYD